MKANDVKEVQIISETVMFIDRLNRSTNNVVVISSFDIFKKVCDIILYSGLRSKQSMNRVWGNDTSNLFVFLTARDLSYKRALTWHGSQLSSLIYLTGNVECHSEYDKALASLRTRLRRAEDTRSTIFIIDICKEAENVTRTN